MKRNQYFSVFIVVFVSMVLQGCLVTRRDYRTQEMIEKNQYTLKTDNLNIECYVFPNSSKDLAITLSFANSSPSESIDNIFINVAPEGKGAFVLEQVSLSSKMVAWESYTDKRYQKKTFADLPEIVRKTTINGAVVNYSFDYVSNRNITAKKLKMAILIEFKGGRKLEVKEDFIVTKWHVFAVH